MQKIYEEEKEMLERKKERDDKIRLE